MDPINDLLVLILSLLFFFLNKTMRSTKRSSSELKAAGAQCTSSSSSTLESLPYEIKYMIFCHLPDISSVSALMHSSPVLYKVFQNQRQHILFMALLNELGVQLLLEAIYLDSAERAASTQDLEVDSNHHHHTQLDSWIKRLKDVLGKIQEHRSRPSEIDEALASVKIETLESIIQTKETIYFHVDEFCKMLQSKKDLPINFPPRSSKTLSMNEKTRIFRALYRLQFVATLFSAHPCRYQNQGHVPTQFFRMWTPWEVEELVCIWEYMTWRSAQLVSDISAQVHANMKWVEKLLEQEYPPQNTNQASSSTGESSQYKAEHLVMDTYELILRADLHVLKEFIEEPYLQCWIPLIVHYAQPVRLPVHFRGLTWYLKTAVDFVNRNRYYVRRIQFSATSHSIDASNAAFALMLSLDAGFGQNQIRYIMNPFEQRWNWIRSWGYAFWDTERLDLQELSLRIMTEENWMPVAVAQTMRRIRDTD